MKPKYWRITLALIIAIPSIIFLNYTAMNYQLQAAENSKRQQCIESGGSWQIGFSGKFCNQATDDYMNRCKDNAECEGICKATQETIDNVNESKSIALVGTCSAWKFNGGCFHYIENNELHDICID